MNVYIYKKYILFIEQMQQYSKIAFNQARNREFQFDLPQFQMNNNARLQQSRRTDSLDKLPLTKSQTQGENFMILSSNRHFASGESGGDWAKTSIQQENDQIPLDGTFIDNSWIRAKAMDKRLKQYPEQTPAFSNARSKTSMYSSQEFEVVPQKPQVAKKKKAFYDQLPNIVGRLEHNRSEQSEGANPRMRQNYSQYFNVQDSVTKKEKLNLRQASIDKPKKPFRASLSIQDLTRINGEGSKGYTTLQTSQADLRSSHGNPYEENLPKEDSIFSMTQKRAQDINAPLPNIMSRAESLYQVGSSGAFGDLDRYRKILMKAKKQLITSYSSSGKDIKSLQLNPDQYWQQKLQENATVKYKVLSTQTTSRHKLDSSNAQMVSRELRSQSSLQTVMLEAKAQLKQRSGHGTVDQRSPKQKSNQRSKTLAKLEEPKLTAEQLEGKYGSVHSNYKLYTNPDNYDHHMTRLLADLNKQKEAVTDTEVLQQKPIEEVMVEGPYPDLPVQNEAFLKVNDKRQYLYFLDESSKQQYVMKLNKNRKERQKKGQEPLSAQEERVSWTVDVLPAIDQDDIRKYGDQMIREIKERKFQQYCKENDLDDSNFVNSAAKKLLGGQPEEQEQEGPSFETEPMGEGSGTDVFAQKKQKAQALKQKFLRKFKTALENIRVATLEPGSIPWHKHIKFDEIGKIDVKAILHRFNINKKMHVDPHNFEIDQTGSTLIQSSIRDHEERQSIKNLLHLFKREHEGVLEHAIYIDGMGEYGQEKAIQYIKGSEEKRNQVRLYLELLKEVRSERDGGGLIKSRREPEVIHKWLNLKNMNIFEFIKFQHSKKLSITSQLSQKLNHFSQFKAALKHSANEANILDPNFSYLHDVENNQNIIYPILQNIHHGSLALYNQKLSPGHVQGISSACHTKPDLVNRVIMQRNDLNDSSLSTLLEAFSGQRDLTKLCISHNEIGKKSFMQIEKILRRNIPKNLAELRIAQCRILPDIHKGHLAKILTKGSLYLRSLGLVQFPLKSEESFKALCEYIAENRHLRRLDLSWNEFTQPFAIKTNNLLLRSICKNEQLTSINLSWNALINNVGAVPDEAKPAKKATKKKAGNPEPLSPYQTIQQTMKYIYKILKLNPRLQYLNLTQTGLNYKQILTVCSWIINEAHDPDGTKVDVLSSKSLQSVHFCQNVAVTDGFLEILGRLLKKEINLEKALEELVPVESQLAALQFHRKDYGERKSQQEAPKEEKMPLQDAIYGRHIKKQKQIEQSQSSVMGNSITDTQESLQNKLILNRIVGHDVDIVRPAEKEWQVLSQQSDSCWIDNLNRYTVIFWKKGHDSEPGRTESMSPADLKQLPPSKVSIQGSLTKFKPQPMSRLIDFLDKISPQIPNIMNQMREDAQIEQFQKEFKNLQAKQKKQFSQIENGYINENVAEWASNFRKYLNHLELEPHFVNGEIVTNLKAQDLSSVYVYFGVLPPGKLSYSVLQRGDVFDGDGELDYRWGPKSEADSREHSKIEYDAKAIAASLDNQFKVSKELHFVDIRAGELTPAARALFIGDLHAVVKPGDFEKSRSNFQELLELDNAKILTSCWQADSSKARLKELLPPETLFDTTKVEEVLEKNYKYIKYLYTLLQADIVDEDQYPYPNITQIEKMVDALGFSSVGIDRHSAREIVEKCSESGQLMRFHLLQIFIFMAVRVAEVEEEKEEEEMRAQEERAKAQMKKPRKRTAIVMPKLKVPQASSATMAPRLSERSAAAGDTPFRAIIARGLKDLFADYVIPNLPKLELFPKAWCTESLFNAQIDQILQLNKSSLTTVFRGFMRVKRNAQLEGIMEILFGADETKGKIAGVVEDTQEASNALDSDQSDGAGEEDDAEEERPGDHGKDEIPSIKVDGQARFGASRCQVLQCYALSKQAIVFEKAPPDLNALAKQRKRKTSRSLAASATEGDYQNMSFPEFLEMIGRIAEIRFRGCELERLSLGEKLLVVIDDILTTNDPDKVLGYKVRSPFEQESKRTARIFQKQTQAHELIKEAAAKKAERTATKKGKKKAK